MRKILSSAVALIMVLVFANTGLCLDKGNLYNVFSKKRVVKVYLPDIENLSAGNKVDAAGLKEDLKQALVDRRSIRFKVVEDKSAADIVIDCDLTAFYWASEDPIDMVLGTASIIYDTITMENYAYQEALFTVTDAKSNEKLWHKRLKIDLTRKNMTEQESIPLINKKTVKTFIRDCFSKKRSKPKSMM